MCLTGTEYTFKTPGPFCFRINGQIYHRISQLEPPQGKNPGFSQIYIYDNQSEFQHRMKTFSNLDPLIIKSLQEELGNVNPYVKVYKHIGGVLQANLLEDIRLVLHEKGPKVDSRWYNLPTGTDVTVLMPADKNHIPSHRDIILYRTAEQHPLGREIISISDKHPMYDPLMYVLMFPHGDKGWDIYQNCTELEYYHHRLMC